MPQSFTINLKYPAQDRTILRLQQRIATLSAENGKLKRQHATLSVEFLRLNNKIDSQFNEVRKALAQIRTR